VAQVEMAVMPVSNSASAGSAGGAGGTALNLQYDVTIDQNSEINGGGGGGGGGGGAAGLRIAGFNKPSKPPVAVVVAVLELVKHKARAVMVGPLLLVNQLAGLRAVVAQSNCRW
jgi:hypothetical protein